MQLRLALIKLLPQNTGELYSWTRVASNENMVHAIVRGTEQPVLLQVEGGTVSLYRAPSYILAATVLPSTAEYTNMLRVNRNCDIEITEVKLQNKEEAMEEVTVTKMELVYSRIVAVQCDVCGYLSRSRRNNRDHSKRHIVEPGEAFVCRKCNKVFPDSVLHSIHERTCKNMCGHCSFCDVSYAKVIKHMKQNHKYVWLYDE